MNDAIKIVIYIFNQLIDLIFNKIMIVDGVSLGWLVLSVVVMMIIISSILNIPQPYNSTMLHEFERAEKREVFLRTRRFIRPFRLNRSKRH